MIIFVQNNFMELKDKTVWITGASSGIGKALSLTFSENGANVIISSRNEEELKKVKAESKHPEKVKILPLDLTDFDSFKKKTETALDLFKGLDILINNGGVSQRSLAADTLLEVDQKLFDVNYFGTIGLTKTVLPYFIKNKKGQIVVISSIMGKLGTPLRSAYAASKHALHGFFDSLRAELYNDHIDVTLICPGYVNTNVSKNALTGDGSKFNIMDEATAKGLNPDEFAKKALQAIQAKKHEVIISGPREKAAVFLKRFYPKFLAKAIRKVNVT
jgi:short-subunit dehydrogenase